MVITMSKYKDLAERLRGKPPTHSTLDRYEAADAIEALEADFHKQADMNGRLLTENAELRQRIAELEAALNHWQKWWEMPWQDRRPDMADLCHMKARKVLGEKE